MKEIEEATFRAIEVDGVKDAYFEIRQKLYFDIKQEEDIVNIIWEEKDALSRSWRLVAMRESGTVRSVSTAAPLLL